MHASTTSVILLIYADIPNQCMGNRKTKVRFI